MCVGNSLIDIKLPLIRILIFWKLYHTLVETRRFICKCGKTLMITSHLLMFSWIIVSKKDLRLRRRNFTEEEWRPFARVKDALWQNHASKSPDGLSFIIKTFNEEHTLDCQKTCQRVELWSRYEDRGNEMDLYGIDIDNKHFGRRGLRPKKSLKLHSFTKLRCYAEMVLSTNPWSMTIVKSEVVVPDRNLEAINENAPPPVFKRMFICYEGIWKGFLEGCRPFFLP